MRERAVELGGTCVVEQSVPQGTRVVARLPLPEDESVERTTEHGTRHTDEVSSSPERPVGRKD
jgi:hypothetical protein